MLAGEVQCGTGDVRDIDGFALLIGTGGSSILRILFMAKNDVRPGTLRLRARLVWCRRQTSGALVQKPSRVVFAPTRLVA